MRERKRERERVWGGERNMQEMALARIESNPGLYVKAFALVVCTITRGTSFSGFQLMFN